MASPKSSSGHVAALRRLATALPQVEEGVSCDKAAFKAGGKAFLFVGHGDSADTVMLKLKGSLPEAKRLAAVHPATYKLGGHNWVTITLDANQALPTELLQRWIEESYRLLVPRAIVAALRGTTSQAAPRAKVSGKVRSRKTRAAQ